MNFELEPLCHRILSALFNGGYQGLLLTLIVWLGLKLLPRTNASTRHAAGLATLLVVAALPPVHFLLGGAPAGRFAESPGPKPEPTIERPRSISQSRVPTSSGIAATRQIQPIPALPAVTGSAELETAAAGRPATRPSTPMDAVPAGSAWVGRSPAVETRSTPGLRRWKASLPGQLALGLTGLWAVCASLRWAKLIGECRFLRSLKRRGGAPAERLRESFEDLRREMRVGRETALLVVPGSAAPMAVGFLKPAVLLPERLLKDSTWGALDQVLRHELAHVRRGDDWANLLQQMVKTTLFFHPAVWWLSSRLTLDREIACDDHVLEATRTPKAYALLLTEFAGRTHDHNCSAAPAGWSRKSQLKERITMILDPDRNTSTNLAKASTGAVIAAAALLAAFSLHAAPRLELRQTSSDAAESATAAVIITKPAGVSTESSAMIATSSPRPKPMPVPRPVVDVPHPVPAPAAAVPPRAPHAPHPVPVVEVEVELADVELHGVPPPGVPGVPPVPRSSTTADRKPQGDSVERRIERLERMIESLIGSGDARPELEPRKKTKPRDEINARNARAVQSLEVQRQILESQRQALELQLGNLEAQIARLEAERDRIEARVEEHAGFLEQLAAQVEAGVELEHAHEPDHELEANPKDSRDRQPKRSTVEPSPKRP